MNRKVVNETHLYLQANSAISTQPTFCTYEKTTLLYFLAIVDLNLRKTEKCSMQEKKKFSHLVNKKLHILMSTDKRASRDPW